MKNKKNLGLIVAFFCPLYCLADTTQPTDSETWIAFLPVIIFFLILIVTTFKLKNDKTKLSNLLSEKDGAAITTGGASAANNDPVAAPVPAQSVSRFIAFLTGLVALAIGVCISTFYMYCYFSNPGTKIDLSNLTNVIWGLGIGVLPYGFNKASAALKQS